MPALTNPKWENACQFRAGGKEVTDAYEAAGFKRSVAAASQFFKKPQIVERVQDIIQARFEDDRKSREIATHEAGIDKAWIFKRLKYLTDISLQKVDLVRRGVVVGTRAADGPTAVKCLTLASNLGGFLVQRHEIGMPGDFARMSDEELDGALAEQARALGIPEDAVGRLIEHRADEGGDL